MNQISDIFEIYKTESEQYLNSNGRIGNNSTKPTPTPLKRRRLKLLNSKANNYLLIGWRLPYVNVRHSHSIGPNLKRLSHHMLRPTSDT